MFSVAQQQSQSDGLWLCTRGHRRKWQCHLLQDVLRNYALLLGKFAFFYLILHFLKILIFFTFSAPNCFPRALQPVRSRLLGNGRNAILHVEPQVSLSLGKPERVLQRADHKRLPQDSLRSTQRQRLLSRRPDWSARAAARARWIKTNYYGADNQTSMAFA